MIANPNTNFVYFSDKLLVEPYRDAYGRVKAILDKQGIESGLLKGTKDIWCRDYMSLQVSKNKFVQFRYEPSYLEGFEYLRSDPPFVWKENGINPIFSNINLDGGNVLQWEDKVIMTDRIYKENPTYSKKELVAELEELLEVKVIVIPQIKSDMTGHADGLVRFYNNDTLIGNNRAMEYDYWHTGIDKVLRGNNQNYIDVPFIYKYKDRKHPDNAIGCYVNFLEVANLIILPIFEVPGNLDDEVLSLFKTYYPDRIIETVNINEIANEGGLLNCITWTIQK